MTIYSEIINSISNKQTPIKTKLNILPDVDSNDNISDVLKYDGTVLSNIKSLGEYILDKKRKLYYVINNYYNG